MTEFKQDMPPAGGYRPINFKRMPAKSYFSGATLFGGYIGMTAAAAYLFYLNVVHEHKADLELKGATLAIYPMLLAERDRIYLKQLRRNREEERELMKNVPGWKVGTFYGEPIFLGASPNKFIDPKIQEYYVHSTYKDMAKRTEFTYLS